MMNARPPSKWTFLCSGGTTGGIAIASYLVKLPTWMQIVFMVIFVVVCLASCTLGVYDYVRRSNNEQKQHDRLDDWEKSMLDSGKWSDPSKTRQFELCVKYFEQTNKLLHGYPTVDMNAEQDNVSSKKVGQPTIEFRRNKK